MNISTISNDINQLNDIKIHVLNIFECWIQIYDKCPVVQ